VSDAVGAAAPAGDPPLVRVVRGRPDDREVAALVTVLGALAAAPSARPPARPASLWGAPTALVRRGAGPLGWGGPSATVPR
jgi:hypothetical protein